MQGKRILAVVMSLCMLSAEASHCAPFITKSITAHADSAETGSNSSGKVKSLTARTGDVNGDGKITEDDKTLLQKWLVNKVSKNELKLNNADVNRDGTVDIMDLVELSRLCAQNPNYTYGSSDENISGLESAALGEDSEIFSEINTDDNAFKVSMDITASSEALASLSASESEYSNVIKNDEIVVGVVPEFECEKGAVVDEVTLNFDIDPNVIGNNDSAYAEVSDDFKGVKRFNVFKYFDDIGMLLPIETKYDTENNSITTTVDELGTYCIVDTEKWFETLGIEPEEFATVNTSVSPVGMLGVPLSVASLTSTKNAENDHIDVVFHAYAKNNTDQNKVESAIMDTATRLFDKYDRNGNVRIYVSNYKGAFAVTDQKLKYAENEEELQTILNKISYVPESAYTIGGFVATNNTDYPTYFKSLMKNCDDNLRVYSEKYYVLVERMLIDANTYEGMIVNNLIMRSMIGVMLSNHSFIETPEQTGGTYIKKTISFGDDVADFIISNHDKYNGKTKYKTFLPNGWKPLALDLSITNDYKKVIDAIKDYNDGKITLEERDKIVGNFNESDFADTDGDGLIDLKEIRYSFDGEDIIDWDSNGEAILPTIGDCMELKSGKEYVKNAFSQCPIWKFWKWSERDQIKNIRILPVKTDPTEKDSDFDDFTDKEDPEPMNYNTITIDDSLLDDNESINGKNPTITQDDLDKMIGHVDPGQTNIDSGSCQKNELVFTRTRKKDRTDGKFSLTPSRNSDFAFIITGTNETKPEGEYTTDDFNSTVKIFYKKGLIMKEEKQVTPVEIKPNDECTEITYVFSLEKGVEYSIYVNNPTNNHEGEYTIHVSEDNWVYAPDGGIITLDDKCASLSSGIGVFSETYRWIHDYKKIYMSNSYLKTWLDMTGDYSTGELNRSALWGVIQSKFYGEDKVLGVDSNTVVEICNGLSTGCTFIGVSLLLLGPNQPFAIGAIVSSIGGITTAIPLCITDEDFTNFSDSLKNALYNCQTDNISLSLEIYGDQTKAGATDLETNEHIVKWSNWDKLYISKYEFEHHGTVFKFTDSPVYYDELILK